MEERHLKPGDFPELDILFRDITTETPAPPPILLDASGNPVGSETTSTSVIRAVSATAASNINDRGSYILEEEDLPDDQKQLLHGRAFVIDRQAISETNGADARSYYIAYDQEQGLVVPARSMAVENTGPGLLHYKWTDDGEHWTAWITLDDGETHHYDVQEKCRFAEVQVYGDEAGILFSLRATR